MGDGMGADDLVQISARPVPQEPMASLLTRTNCYLVTDRKNIVTVSDC